MAGILRDAEVAPRRLAEVPRAKRAKRTSFAHLELRVHAGLQCGVCHKMVSKPSSIAAFAEQACDGNGASRLVLDNLGRHAVSNGHRLWRTGGVVWCAVCGCHTTRRLRGLAERCGARPVQQLARRNLAVNCPMRDVETMQLQRLSA